VPLPNLHVPSGDLRYVYLHWTAGDDATSFDAYHFCVARRMGVWEAVNTHDLRANMRDVSAFEGPYAAHTAGRNSFAIGIAVCGMRDARPDDFGDFPLCEAAVDATCELTARLCAAYAIPVDAAHVRTHAEAAVQDGYFGSGEDERWDIARLIPAAAPLVASEATSVGEVLRDKVARAMENLR
jgi:hypothetical protein